MMNQLVEAAKNQKLVVFVGAGVSTLPPTSLPSWSQVNAAVLTALEKETAKVSGKVPANQLASTILERQKQKKMPPEYQAEIIADRLSGTKYFDVLQCLDSQTPNSVHQTIARLAKKGCLAAIITTNFDRTIEAALTKEEVAFAKYFKETDYEKFASCTDLPLLKLHGCVEDSSSLIDTLAQRGRGFGEKIAQVLRQQLHDNHWLFLGYSGLDLQARPNYLFLRGDVEKAKGFTWLWRSGDHAHESLDSLVELYGNKGELVYGTLPEWLLNFAKELDCSTDGLEEESEGSDQSVEVREHTEAWAASFGPIRCSVILSDLATAASQGQEARSLLCIIQDAVEKEGSKDEAISYLYHALAFHQQDIGRYEKAEVLLLQALKILEESDPLKQKAAVYSSLGQVKESRGFLNDAEEYYEKAEIAYKEKGGILGQIQTLDNMASLYFIKSDFQKALEKYQAKQAICENEGDIFDLAITKNQIASVWTMQGKYADALKLIEEEAIVTFQRVGEEERIADCWNNIGSIHYLEQRYDDAMAAWEKARVVYEKLNLKSSMGHIQNNIALIHMKKGELAKAKEILENLVQLFYQQKDLAGQGKALGNLANINRQEKDYATAEGLYQRCFSAYQKMDNESAAAPWYRELSVMYREQENWEQASHYQNQALIVFEGLEDWKSCGDNAHDLALLESKQKNYTFAAKWAQKSSEYYKKVGLNSEAERSLGLHQKYQKLAKSAIGCSWLFLLSSFLLWFVI